MALVNTEKRFGIASLAMKPKLSIDFSLTLKNRALPTQPPDLLPVPGPGNGRYQQGTGNDLGKRRNESWQLDYLPRDAVSCNCGGVIRKYCNPRSL